MALIAGSFAFQSKEKKQYLRYNSEAGPRFQYIKSSIDDVRSPNIKFEVEKATAGDGSYVHIRSSYNNKYLRRLDNGPQHWIVAAAEKKEEDTSEWSCTLFQPIKVGDDQNTSFIQLRHVQLGHYTQLYGSSGDYEGCMIANSPTPADVYKIFNWETLVILPQYVAFKGNNGRYLRCGPDPYFMFFNTSDIGELGVAQEIFPTADGDVVCIKPYQMFDPLVEEWCVTTDIAKYDRPGYPGYTWITAYSTYGDDDIPRRLFQPFKVDGNVIALRNLYTNKFCRLDTEVRGVISKFTDGLAPDATSITEAAKLVVEEPVMKRTITVTYRLNDARTYDIIPVTMTSFEHYNHDTEAITKNVTLKFKEEVTTTWDATNSWTAGVTTAIHVDAIPFVSDLSVELSAQYGKTYALGQTRTEEKETEETDEYHVPGKHKLVVLKLASKGHCDVPYSYTQTDHLYNGKVIQTTKSDGIFKGTNYFKLTTHHYVEEIPESK